MALVRVTYWRDVPVLVTARGGGGEVTVSLSPRFQELVDVVAVQAGQTDAEAYLAGWRTGPDQDRPGPPEAVARTVADELEAAFAEIRARLLA